MKKYLLILLFLNFYFSELLKPEDGITLNQIYVLFEWEQQPGNNFYVLDISENPNNIDGDCIICDQYVSGSLIHIQKDLIDWNKTYYWKVVSYGNDNEATTIGSASFSTSNPISNTTINLSNSNIQEGLTIFGSFFDYYSAVIDEAGTEIWNSAEQDLIFYNTDQYGRFFGSEFIGNNEENNYPGIKFSFENGIQWQDPGDNFIHHDIFQLPNGNYIGLGTSYQMGPIALGPWTGLFQILGYEADGITDEFQWMGDKIIEWDAETKEEVWSWNVFDHFNMSDNDSLGGIWFEAYNTDRFDWTHANAIWWDEDDSAIYLSSRHLNRITKIAYPSGDIIWNLGYEFGSGDIDCGQDIGFSFQHSLQKLNNGNILTIDNGNLSTELLNQDVKTSRSIEINVTETNNGCDAELAWEYVLPEELYGYLSGNTQKLDNGNYLSTTIGGGGTSIEVDENGNQIWEANYNLQLPDGLVYRAMRIPGIFPIAYSVIFPQMDTDLSEITINNDSLHVLIKNNGDYTQLFNYELWAGNIDDGWNIEFIITPQHHPENKKTSYFSIISTDFDIQNQFGSFTLNPNQNTVLSFIDDIIMGNNLDTEQLIFNLQHPYPNPFNPVVNFDLDVSKTEYINIDIYDVKGNRINNIWTGVLNYGIHSFNWDGTDQSTGIYFIKCSAKNMISTQKIFLIK